MAASLVPLVEKPNFKKKKQQTSETTFGGLCFGKFAFEQSVLAFCRLAVTTGPRQSGAND